MRAGKLLIGCAVLLSAGCLMRRGVVTPPERVLLAGGQLVFHSDLRLPCDHWLLQELVALRSDIAERLALSVSHEPIDVRVFDSPTRFREYMETHYPLFPDRRAYFVKNDSRLTIYASWGDRVAEDLRHEVTHGYLHTMVPRIPLWIDEGLAEYFEVPRDQRGRNESHLATISATGPMDWMGELERLEQLDDPAEMNQVDYAAAWAWTHFLLETTDQRRDQLRDYLARIQTTGAALPLSHGLRAAEPAVNQHLDDHLRQLSVDG
jgi:hypothetical protein